MTAFENHMDSVIKITPEEAYKLSSNGFPGGTYKLMDGIARLYRAEPIDQNSWVSLIFMLATAFTAGVAHAAREEVRE